MAGSMMSMLAGGMLAIWKSTTTHLKNPTTANRGPAGRCRGCLLEWVDHCYPATWSSCTWPPAMTIRRWWKQKHGTNWLIQWRTAVSKQTKSGMIKTQLFFQKRMNPDLFCGKSPPKKKQLGGIRVSTIKFEPKVGESPEAPPIGVETKWVRD